MRQKHKVTFGDDLYVIICSDYFLIRSSELDDYELIIIANAERIKKDNKVVTNVLHGEIKIKKLKEVTDKMMYDKRCVNAIWI